MSQQLELFGDQQPQLSPKAQFIKDFEVNIETFDTKNKWIATSKKCNLSAISISSENDALSMLAQKLRFKDWMLI